MLVIAVVFVLIAIAAIVPQQEDFRELLLWTLAGVGLLTVSGTALAAFFFGVKALLESRRAGDR